MTIFELVLELLDVSRARASFSLQNHQTKYIYVCYMKNIAGHARAEKSWKKIEGDDKFLSMMYWTG